MRPQPKSQKSFTLSQIFAHRYSQAFLWRSANSLRYKPLRLAKELSTDKKRRASSHPPPSGLHPCLCRPSSRRLRVRYAELVRTRIDEMINECVMSAAMVKAGLAGEYARRVRERACSQDESRCRPRARHHELPTSFRVTSPRGDQNSFPRPSDTPSLQIAKGANPFRVRGDTDAGARQNCRAGES